MGEKSDLRDAQAIAQQHQMQREEAQVYLIVSYKAVKLLSEVGRVQMERDFSN